MSKQLISETTAYAETPEIRRHQDNIIVSAMALLILCVWDFIKMLLEFLFNDDYIKALAGDDYVDGINYFFIPVLIIFFLVFFAYKYYISRCAIREARGGRPGDLYLIMLVPLMVVAVSNIGARLGLFNLDAGDDVSQPLISYLLIEATSLAIDVQLIYSVITIRRLRRQLVAEKE